MLRRIFFKDALELEIILIGYAKQGESVLFFVKDNDNVHYAGLVDCYKTKSCNIVDDLLKENNVKTLDFVCWTHPHDDHSKGMDDIISNYCNHKTKFYTTDIIPEDYDLYSKECVEIYKRIRAIHLSRDLDKMPIKYVKDNGILENLVFSSINNYSFQIMSFAPNSTILAERICRNQDEVGNEYSIGLIINIGHFFIMLGGDVENNTINMLDYELGDAIDYIKIPHHGSETAKDLVNKMQLLNIMPPSIATSTVFRKHNLPSKTVFAEYKKWGTDELYCTGDLDDENKDQYEYGIIRTSFDVLEKKEYVIETVMEKNAVNYLENN